METSARTVKDVETPAPPSTTVGREGDLSSFQGGELAMPIAASIRPAIVRETINSVVVTTNGKRTYSMDALRTFRDLYTTLPANVNTNDSLWPPMSVAVGLDTHCSPVQDGRGGRGNRRTTATAKLPLQPYYQSPSGGDSQRQPQQPLDAATGCGNLHEDCGESKPSDSAAAEPIADTDSGLVSIMLQTIAKMSTEREQRAPPASAPSGGGGRPDAYRMDSRRSSSGCDVGGGFSQRSAMPTVYSSQSINSRSGSVKQMTLPLGRRGIQRDGSVKTGLQGRPASFGSANARRAPASAGPTMGKKPMGGRGNPSTPKNGGKDADRPTSPVVAALSDDDKEKIAKKAKSFAEEYVSIVDLGEADTCLTELLKEFKSHAQVHAVVASAILKLAIEAKVDIQRAMFDLLEKLSVEKASLSFDGIRAGIKATLELGNDLWCDVPKLHEHLAGFVVRFAKISDKSGVTLDWLMCGCVDSLDAEIYEELIQGGFLAEVCGCVLKMLKEISAEKAKAQVRSTQVTLLSLFPDYKQTPKDFKQWIDKHDIGDALALQPAVDFALHWINSMELQETVDWYEKTVSQDVKKDHVFSTLACLFVIGSVKKGALPSDAEGMLLNGLCVSVESQTSLVAGLFQTRGAVPDEADAFKALLKHLVKVERAIPGIALTKWLELKNDNSVGRKRALAAFGDFVEELSKTK